MSNHRMPDQLRLWAGAMSPDDFIKLQESLATLPKNDVAWTYTIRGFDGSPYITRTLLPRMFGWRPMIHQIHRDDTDQWPHNHPWRRAIFQVVRGGYVDERWWLDGAQWRVTRRQVLPGDDNTLGADDFHRAIEVQPGTLTAGLVADRVQDWGFLVDGQVVPHAEYFARRGHVEIVGGLT